MEDFNAVVGVGKEDRVVGKFGLGKRDDRGERLIKFCKSQNLVITNTWFEQEKKKKIHMEESRTLTEISN